MIQMYSNYDMTNSKIFAPNIGLTIPLTVLGICFSYMLQERDLTRFFEQQTIIKKEQQTSDILNSQSDGIVAVKIVQEENQSVNVEGTLEFEFCNSKSIEMLGFDPKANLDNQLLVLTRFVLLDQLIASHRSVEPESLSLKDVVFKKIDPLIDKVESYAMHSRDVPVDHESSRTIIVKRFDLTINEKLCLVLNLTDITAYQRLKNEKEKSSLLSTLNTSVHHELIGPLKINVEMAKRLMLVANKVKLPPQMREMAQTIEISSKQVLLHANDFLDQQLIKHGKFTPHFTPGSVVFAINEVVKMMRTTLERKDLKITSNLAGVTRSGLELQFDKRRLQ